jgi:integrase/recombinase XerD
MTKENHKLFNEYLEYEKLKGHTEQGYTDLRTRVPHFIEYIECADIEIGRIGVKEAQGYQGWLLEKTNTTGNSLKKRYKNMTVISYVYPASAFCEYLRRKGLIPSNPFRMIRRLRMEKRIPRNIPKEAEMERFLELLSRFDEEGNLKAGKNAYRVHVAAELMYSTGMRISEVAGLMVSDIDFEKSIVYVNRGKGGESRIAWLSDYSREVLRLYVMEIRELLFNELNKRNSSLLFGVRWGWFGHVVNKRLQKAAQKLSMPGFTCHMFRHAVGYHLLRSGCNIRHIQEILGHKKLKSTEIYTKVDISDLKSVLDRCHPRKWSGK